MIDKFIEELKSSAFYPLIFHGHEIIMLYLSGSRLINIVDDHSDYDLVAITNDTDRVEDADEFLTYNGVKVHWHYIPILKLITNEQGSPMSCYGQVLFANLNEGKIIYENSKYEKAIDCLKTNKDSISRVGVYELVKCHEKLITSILQCGTIEEKQYCKFIYHLCYACYFILGEMPDPQFLTAVKRIRWQPIEEVYKIKAVERIRALQDFVSNNWLDVQEEIVKVNDELRKSLM